MAYSVNRGDRVQCGRVKGMWHTLDNGTVLEVLVYGTLAVVAWDPIDGVALSEGDVTTVAVERLDKIV